MPRGCLLYYITDRTAFAGDEATRRRLLLEKIAEAARAGVDWIQLREKDLSTRELESLAREAVQAIREARAKMSHESRTALLINSRTDVALAVGAEGVHLRSEDISPDEVREIWKCCDAENVFDTAGRRPPLLAKAARSGAPQVPPLIGVSCHTSAEVAKAAAGGATFAVFAPVFEKQHAPGAGAAGLALLEQACREKIPVLALGGVTTENARACLKAGAAGIAAIRLFQENDVGEVVGSLRE
jgi:thiamine-phosphate pyrophosphorylase